MAKIKIQKKDIWIDMTPMSDVMTLLLCFFMLTSTFLTPEPVSVTAPNSVSEVKIPEQDLLTILVTPEGKIFAGTENKNHMKTMLETMTDKFGVQLNANQQKHFLEDAMVGAPMAQLSTYLNLEPEKMTEAIQTLGLPLSVCRSTVSTAVRASSRSGSQRPAMQILTSNSPSSATPRLLMQLLRS